MFKLTHYRVVGREASGDGASNERDPQSAAKRVRRPSAAAILIDARMPRPISEPVKKSLTM